MPTVCPSKESYGIARSRRLAKNSRHFQVFGPEPAECGLANLRL